MIDIHSLRAEPNVSHQESPRDNPPPGFHKRFNIVDTKRALFVAAVAGLALTTGQAHADLVNGSFTITKPGTGGVVTGTLNGLNVFDSYVKGVGTSRPLNGPVRTVTWDDESGTSPAGGPVDLLGWTSVNGGNPDTGKNGVGGSSGLNIFAAWGGDQRVQGATTMTIAADTVYRITAQIDGPAGGPIAGALAFHLVAGGVQLTADAPLTPFVGGLGFQTITRTYTIGSLPGGVNTGAPLTVILGVENSNDNGDRMIWDNVQLAVVPEPSSYAMALAGIACGGYLIRRRKPA